ncbi:MAG: hypothetical protein M9944_03545 [Rhizobiaceae bacterium]|nr:hypothetical protein [Rhizobiaceae bacterium]
MAQVATARIYGEVGSRIAENTQNGLGQNYEILLDYVAQKELINEIIEDLTQPSDPSDPNGPWAPSPPRDPLVADLDGDGIELISVAESQAYFDFGGDGFAERTGWLEPDDGFLFEDTESDGVASGISELFGSEDEDGFTELSRYDVNGDVKIDANDPVFSSLRI